MMALEEVGKEERFVKKEEVCCRDIALYFNRSDRTYCSIARRTGVAKVNQSFSGH